MIKQTKDMTLSVLKKESANKNMIFSPLAIQTALEMLAEGAVGETKAQIEAVLPEGKAAVFSNNDGKFSQACALFLGKNFGHAVKDDYIQKQKKLRDAEVFTDVKDPDEINGWFKEKTLGLIPKVVDKISPEMVLSLVSALAIDMKWREKFNGGVDHGSFYSIYGNPFSVIETSGTFRSDAVAYSQNIALTVLSMDLEPCGDTQLEYIAVMPENLSRYLRSLTPEKLKADMSGLTKSSELPYGIDVTVPRFSFDHSLNFKNDLKALDITDVFDPDKADLSAMSDAPLYVSEASHMAKIDFSEKGIKAGAACHIVAVLGCLPVERPYIVIDHPFLFVIRDKKSGAVLFAGTVYEPERTR